jgi:hypothetical protein
MGYILLLLGACAVARVALVKPDKARNVENMILTAAKRGALQSKVSHNLSITKAVWVSKPLGMRPTAMMNNMRFLPYCRAR